MAGLCSYRLVGTFPLVKHSFDLKEIILLAANKVFRYNQLRGGQFESMEAYLSGKDTLVSIKIGGRKPVCYSGAQK